MKREIQSRQPLLDPVDNFDRRHIGPRASEIGEMLALLGFGSLDELTDAVVPESIRTPTALALDEPRGEHETLGEIQALAAQNRPRRAFIGQGYHDCIPPPVVLRNILENPGWYTQYTPYQAEIAQGRLEALLNFQTMVSDLTALPLANASLLDEGTAAAEAMQMCHALTGRRRAAFAVADDCHPQTVAVLQTRARPLGIALIVERPERIDFGAAEICGVLLQYPATDGSVRDLSPIVAAAHASGAYVVVATDLLALTLLRAPGEFGADIAVGSAQRFGVPLGFGGPHAAFLATRDEFKRQIPGRIVGMSRDATGRAALRLAMQTREQHIRRDKATSNICTAQVLLAVIAGAYAVYHGAEGLRRIARRVRRLTLTLAAGLERLGARLGAESVFDTLKFEIPGRSAGEIVAEAQRHGMNLRDYGDGRAVGVALDEATTIAEVESLLRVLASAGLEFAIEELIPDGELPYPPVLARTSEFLSHPVFREYHAEHDMLRYLHRLQARDLSLTQSMIPLGSCTMKLNGTALMMPLSSPAWSRIHPFAAEDECLGYLELFRQLETWLAEITGFKAVSLQPNSGAQGEYAGLLVIRAWHDSRGDHRRDICLIPTSAHGTNPASAVMVGMRVVAVECDPRGNVDLTDLEAKAERHRDELAALMITYPSTHGVFEHEIRKICELVHARGGQVYMDGANMNAQVGLCRPGEIGADVVHLNLHKTFCIPHGGGGPGMGPIAVAGHLAPFLPGHPSARVGGSRAIGPVSAAPWGSASILTIPWMYIRLMGGSGLRRATQVAILSANYMARRLEGHYRVLYSGNGGLVAHEFILDVRPFRDSANVTPDDIAKRLMDFGLHAPTISWPVAGTLMIEPTESESRDELDRYCEALIAIRDEIRAIETGESDRENNPLRRAPHPVEDLLVESWDRPYSREQAAYPLPWVRSRKFWPAVGRIDNAWGDRNLVCTCGTVESFAVDP